MKKNFLFLSLATLIFSSCIKQIDKTFQGKTVVEIDATPLNSTAVGVNYPILTRVVPQGRPISTTVDSTLRRFADTVRVRVNLVGPQSAKEETVGYTTVGSPITSIAFPATITGQTPSRTAGTLAVLDAIAGTHYAVLSGKVTIPANSSFGYINVKVLNAGAVAGQARYLGIRLDSTGSLMPSVNYMQLGLVIDQR
ncbi:MAG TPA: hypothetical protein VEY10_05080 [Flavisolibacter sp.]|jgi:hypothetical protein|nr:hypothetical protein [Flavisolibacter sp.]